MESKDITYSEEAVIPKLQNPFKQHLRAGGMISGIALSSIEGDDYLSTPAMKEVKTH